MTYVSGNLESAKTSSTAVVDAAVSTQLSMEPSTHHAPILPDGYFADEDGIHYLELDSNGDVHPEWICSPIELVGICARAGNTGWGRVLDVLDPDGQTHQLILDETALNGPVAALLRPLHNVGLKIAKNATARKRVTDLLSVELPLKRFVRAGCTGWLDGDFDTFVVADGSVLGRKSAILERDFGSFGTAAATNGSFEEWRDGVAALCVGNPLLLLAVSQAFAGPLLAPLGLDGGGFHFRGASSCGKSTALGIAASVWGSPKYVQSWRATDNGLEGVATGCNSALLALDELHQVSPHVVGEAVYMLANGRAKQRLSSNGKLGSSATWHVALLSSGEISLQDHLASGGKKMHAGQDIRLIDIGADGRKFGAFDDLHAHTEARRFAEELQRAAAVHYGHAGRHFVQQLIDKIGKLDVVQRSMNLFVQKVLDSNDLAEGGEVPRALKKFALAAVAGELATNFGLTGWNKGEAYRAIKGVASAWLEDREIPCRGDVDVALDRTRAYLTLNPERFNARGQPAGSDGWRNDSWIYILPEAWARIHGRDQAVEAARLHKAAGLLLTDKGETLQLRMGRDTPERPKVYAVSARVLKS